MIMIQYLINVGKTIINNPQNLMVYTTHLL
jgi:hypothetical protein